MHFPLTYAEPVYRPPSEAESLLLQVTIGCSHNACTFCAMYRDKRFTVRPLEDIRIDLQKAAGFFAASGYEAPRKIFFCDGDAHAAPTELLLAVLEETHSCFPKLQRVGIYASARTLLDKSTEELKALAAHKLNTAYLGVESGSDEVLELIHKKVTASEVIEACLRAREAGWKISSIIMLGLGGRELSAVHRRESAKVISLTAPNFLSFLTTTVVPGTPYARSIEKGELHPLTVRETLEEMHDLIRDIDPGAGRIIFRANHASNLLPLEGILPRDRARLAETVASWTRSCPPDLYLSHDPRRL